MAKGDRGGLAAHRMLAAGAGVGLAAAGAAVAAHRHGPRRHPGDEETFGHTPDLAATAVATDGVGLHVEVDAPAGSRRSGRPTVVLCHGFTLNLTSWVAQRRALIDAGWRVVVWDQRGHGMSAGGDRERSTIDQLGKDLRCVLEAVAPRGPLVLVGHSMGAMTVMSLAGQYPELIAERVRAVALVSTSAGGMSLVHIGFGRLLDLAVVRLGPGVLTRLSASHRLWRGLRQVGRDAELVTVQRYAFGRRVPREVLRHCADMIFGTSLETTAAFLPQLDELDVRDALAGLAETEVLVMVGGADQLTPPSHSEEIVAALPRAEHVVVPGAGHMLPMEEPETVSREVISLIERGLAGRGRSRRTPATPARARAGA